MNKMPVLIGMLIFAAGFAYPQQENIFQHPLGARTEASFRAVCQSISQRPIVRGTFEQEKIIKRLNRSLKSSGDFIIAAHLGMVWNTANPFPSTLVLGRDFLIQSRPGGQRTLLGASGNETFLRMADVISTVFTGNAQGLMDNFEIFFFQSSSSWEIALIPLDRAINSFANMIMMSGDTVIRSIQITEQNDDIIKYTLSNHSFPEALNANENALFTFP